MKFFTSELGRAQPFFEGWAAARDAYQGHLGRMKGVLPDRVLELAALPGVETGLVVCVEHDREGRLLKLVLRGGDLQMGYYNLIIAYDDAEILPEHDANLAKIARSTKGGRTFACDLARHELDLAEDGRLEHRLIFYASGFAFREADGLLWFAIRCRSLRWRTTPRRSRRLSACADRYPGGPATD